VGIQQWKDSLVIWGRFETSEAPSPWARSPLELQSHTHIDLWFSAADSVPMPEIQWGNQFGYVGCAEYAPSQEVASAREARCDAWRSQQIPYREQLRRLFARKWQLAPDVSTEDLATPAYREASKFADKLNPDSGTGFVNDFELRKLKPLEPAGSPAFTSWNGEGFTGFQIVVARSVFPPVASLNLSQVRIVVEVVEGVRIVASTSPKRKNADPSSFKALTLGHPITSKITSCEAPLEIWRPAEQLADRPAWFFPTSNGFISDIFVLANQRIGYRRDPDGLSPLPVWSHHFEKVLDNGDIICGPALRLKTPGKVWAEGAIDEKRLSVFKLNDGAFLLKSGPTFTSYSPFGNGMCGACPVVSVRIYHLSRATGITTAFTSSMRLEGLADGSEEDSDIQLSPDWNTVTVFRRQRQTDTDKLQYSWSSTKFCRSGRTYMNCGDGPAGPPPDPRQVNWLDDRR
jgi:hypothetical protein